MAQDFTIEVADGITIVRFLKPPGVDVMYRVVNEVSERYPNIKRLWDINCGWDLTEQELRQVAEFSKEAKLPKNSKAAIVASKDLAFGLSRMYEAYRYDERVEHGVFRTEAEALAWLNADVSDQSE